MINILRCLLPTLFLFLLIGLQSAFSCQVPSHAEQHTNKIQVNTCHFNPDLAKPHVCCDSAACHRDLAPLRHLGSPEFANQIKDLLPLILESRQQIPQPKSAPFFAHRLNGPHSDHLTLVTSQAPPISLTLLRTAVLLH